MKNTYIAWGSAATTKPRRSTTWRRHYYKDLPMTAIVTNKPANLPSQWLLMQACKRSRRGWRVVSGSRESKMGLKVNKSWCKSKQHKQRIQP